MVIVCSLTLRFCIIFHALSRLKYELLLCRDPNPPSRSLSVILYAYFSLFSWIPVTLLPCYPAKLLVLSCAYSFFNPSSVRITITYWTPTETNHPSFQCHPIPSASAISHTPSTQPVLPHPPSGLHLRPTCTPSRRYRSGSRLRPCAREGREVRWIAMRLYKSPN